jgi:hypothetical protein
MDAVIEAMQILRVDELVLFQRAQGWFHGAQNSNEASAKSLHDLYRATRTYPACVLAYVAAVRRNGGAA